MPQLESRGPREEWSHKLEEGIAVRKPGEALRDLQASCQQHDLDSAVLQNLGFTSFSTKLPTTCKRSPGPCSQHQVRHSCSCELLALLPAPKPSPVVQSHLEAVN